MTPFRFLLTFVFLGTRILFSERELVPPLVTLVMAKFEQKKSSQATLTDTKQKNKFILLVITFLGITLQSPAY